MSDAINNQQVSGAFPNDPIQRHVNTIGTAQVLSGLFCFL